MSCWNPKEAICILVSFKLDQVVTCDDDPVLWAKVLEAHFDIRLVHSKQCLFPGGFDFLVGIRVPKTYATTDSDGTFASHVLCFAQLQAQEHWRLSSCLGEGLEVTKADVGKPLGSYWNILAIERPSRGVEMVRILLSRRYTDVNGNGVLEIWKRNADGSWRPDFGPGGSRQVWVS